MSIWGELRNTRTVRGRFKINAGPSRRRRGLIFLASKTNASLTTAEAVPRFKTLCVLVGLPIDRIRRFRPPRPQVASRRRAQASLKHGDREHLLVECNTRLHAVCGPIDFDMNQNHKMRSSRIPTISTLQCEVMHCLRTFKRLFLQVLQSGALCKKRVSRSQSFM